MSEIIFAAIITGIGVSIMLYLGPPKKWWCDSKELHEFNKWEDFVGPSKNHHYQSRNCKKMWL